MLAVVATAALLAAAPSPSPQRVYEASLAYAKCMRAHGIPQPNPDRSGNIELTPAIEARMRRIGRAKVQAADKLCFDLHLKGVVSTKPLSAAAQLQAIDVLKDVDRCVRGYGYELGHPVVKNLSRGRAFFGFSGAPPVADRAGLQRAEHACERRVSMAKRIDAIVEADRSPV